MSIPSTHAGSTLTLTGELPKGYEPRAMYLYVARTRSKWGFWLSDGDGYSVRALVDNLAPKGSGRVSMAEWFSTKHAATQWALGHGWTPWMGLGRRGVPTKARVQSYAVPAKVASFIVHPRQADAPL